MNIHVVCLISQHTLNMSVSRTTWVERRREIARKKGRKRERKGRKKGRTGRRCQNDGNSSGVWLDKWRKVPKSGAGNKLKTEFRWNSEENYNYTWTGFGENAINQTRHIQTWGIKGRRFR